MKITGNTMAAVLVFTGCLFLGACTQHRPLANAPGTNAAEPGRFTVSLTDSPGDFSELSIDIRKVEAYLDNRGWVLLSSSPMQVNVLELTNGRQVDLVRVNGMSSGSYSKIRLTLGNENYVRFKPGYHRAGIALDEEGLARLSMYGHNQVEIDINGRVNHQEGVNVLLDFNVAQSVSKGSEGWMLHPVITEIEDVTTGISGMAQEYPGAAILLSDGVYTYSTYVDENGRFLLRGIDAGTYDLMIIPAGETMLDGNEHTMEGVLINNGQITQVGEISL